jgi:hypothetical protein
MSHKKSNFMKKYIELSLDIKVSLIDLELKFREFSTNISNGRIKITHEPVVWQAQMFQKVG